MTPKTTKIIIGLLLPLLVIIGLVYFLKTNPKNNTVLENTSSTTQITQLANPASTNCLAKGGMKVEIRNSKKGQYGVCLFEDNRQCEEWALFRGECPVGGLKVTGYENDAQVYCAITGGKVTGLGTENPMCQRIDGTFCNAQANLDGDCPDPHDSNPSAGNTEK